VSLVYFVAEGPRWIVAACPLLKQVLGQKEVEIALLRFPERALTVADKVTLAEKHRAEYGLNRCPQALRLVQGDLAPPEAQSEVPQATSRRTSGLATWETCDCVWSG